jgi:transposase
LSSALLKVFTETRTNVKSPANLLSLFPNQGVKGLPEKHLARFLVDAVDDLNLSALHASCEAGDGRGQPAYAPAMMVRASKTCPHFT